MMGDEPERTIILVAGATNQAHRVRSTRWAIWMRAVTELGPLSSIAESPSDVTSLCSLINRCRWLPSV